MAQLPSIKQGDSLILQVVLPEDTLVSELKSQVRNGSGVLIDEFDITTTSTPGKFSFVILDTSSWKIGNYQMDIRRTIGEIVETTQTITIPVIGAITQ